MKIWKDAVMTQKGLGLQSKLMEGVSLEITRAVTGTAYIDPAALAYQTQIVDERQELSFRPVSYPEEGKCTVTAGLTNDTLETGYKARQVGFYANDPDEGEILYFIAQSDGEDGGTVVPAGAALPGYSAEWTFTFHYGQADGVIVYVDPTGTINREELEEYIEKTFVPISSAEIDKEFSYEGGGGSGEGGGGGGYDPDTLTPMTSDDIDKMFENEEEVT